MPFADVVPLLRRAERWLLPGSCLLCKGTVEREEDDPLICALCRARFHRLPHPQCVRCGQPSIDVRQPCRLCPAWPDGFDRARSAVWLDDRARHAVHHLKYGGWSRVADALARSMIGLSDAPDGAILVPIPLARGRFRRRGYNQAEALARAVATQRGVALDPTLLRRARETTSQTRLTPEARAVNLAEAFVARECAGAQVVLVDDVFTTGATLVAAATALLEAGAAAVEAITFARARPPLG
ncbi:MAG TPA: phosphoribosyltransferase family protein [Gemmatimonadales bacterium]|nr:phosphoribosyltransferase family protein [Gemmatimonadales bacterium]